MFVRALILAGIAVLSWTMVARPSTAHGPKQVYTVKAYDTLWTIASAHYSGDPRDAVWRIESRNHLAGTIVQPGQRIVLP